jgi:hypothetical protein
MTTITRHVPTAGAALLLCLLAQPSAAEIRDRITPAQMRQRQASSEWKSSGEAGAPRDPRAKSPAQQSIIAQSTILSDGTYWTLVPTGSVLYVPEKHRQRVVKKPAGTLLNWSQFSGRNRSWLGIQDVDLETAAGEKPLGEAAIQSWAKRGTVVVAVHRGGAISIKQPEPEAPANANPPADRTTPSAS